jgi:hypothetical protein
MKKQVAVLVIAAVVIPAAAAIALATTGQTVGVESARAVQTAQPSTTLVVHGTIEKYDASNRILSLSTSNGTVQFSITSATRIRQGWHRVDRSALQNMGGYRATVRYSSESGADKTVESVHVVGK